MGHRGPEDPWKGLRKEGDRRGQSIGLSQPVLACLLFPTPINVSLDMNCLLECQLQTRSPQDQERERKKKEVTVSPTNTNHLSPVKTKNVRFPTNHSPVPHSSL